MVTDSFSILAKWKNHFSQLFNVHGVSDVRQTDIYIYIYIQQKQIMPEISAFHFEMAMEKLK